MLKDVVAAFCLFSLVPASLCGCDSGFEKVSEPEPEPAPEPEPEPEGTDAAADEPFFPEPSTFEIENANEEVSELEDGQLLALCEGEQVRLDDVFRHFSAEEELCRLVAVRQAISEEPDADEFQETCEAALEECLDDSEASLRDIWPDAAAILSCETWQGSAGCDPELGDLDECLQDIVSTVVERLQEVDCASSLDAAADAALELTSFAEARTPFDLSSQCSAASCLLAGDAGL